MECLLPQPWEVVWLAIELGGGGQMASSHAALEGPLTSLACWKVNFSCLGIWQPDVSIQIRHSLESRSASGGDCRTCF